MPVSAETMRRTAGQEMAHPTPFPVLKDGDVAPAARAMIQEWIAEDSTRAGVDQPSEYHGDPRFYALLQELARLHSDKSHDYTPASDPFANFKAAEAFGVEAWRGVLVRMGDKWSRLQQLTSGKAAKHESVEDSLRDLAVYALICLLLFRDAKG